MLHREVKLIITDNAAKHDRRLMPGGGLRCRSMKVMLLLLLLLLLQKLLLLLNQLMVLLLL